MADAMLYDEDMYVLLAPGEAEVFMTPPELLAHLQALLSERQDNLPRDLQRFPEPAQQAEHLMSTSCELEIAPGKSIQWYADRLEK